VKPQYIYIFNIPEDVWPLIKSISNKKEQTYEIDWCANVAERDLITIAKEKDPIFICPKKIDSEYINYINNLFNIKNITILTPYKNTGEISKDIINDENIIDKLLEFKKLKLLVIQQASNFQILLVI